jgi:hypothetical protein
VKPRLVIGRRPHAWLAVLFAALFAAGLSAQMPDPRQMSGQVLPSADLPTGSVTVRVIRQTMANTAPGIEVELHGAGEVRRATTGQQGRAQFDGLPPGARVHVVAIVDGERLESIEFPVPGSGGARTLLAAGVGAGTPGSGGALSAPRPASPLAASSGTLRLGADTRFAIEFQDDQLTVFYLLEFVNPGQTALAPTPVVIELPTAATGASFMQGAPQGAGIAGSRVTIPGPFAPGVTQVPIAFRIESWPADWTLDQRFPLPLDNIAVAAQKLTGMTLESPQATTVRETTFQGLPYLVAIGKGVAAGTPLTVTLRGLPHRSPIALYVALLVAVGLVVWGVWAARSRQRPEEATRRRQLESRRHRGLSTLAALDEQARAGTIDLQAHADKRAELLHELERIYRELDSTGDLPGGDAGLAA